MQTMHFVTSQRGTVLDVPTFETPVADMTSQPQRTAGCPVLCHKVGLQILRFDLKRSGVAVK